MLEWDDWMHGWAAMGEAPAGERGWTLRVEGHGRGSVLSVGQGLIELEGTARSVVGIGSGSVGSNPAD